MSRRKSSGCFEGSLQRNDLCEGRDKAIADGRPDRETQTTEKAWETARVGKNRIEKEEGTIGRDRRSLYLEKAARWPRGRALPKRVMLSPSGRSLER